jgi:hypothetical protein
MLFSVKALAKLLNRLTFIARESFKFSQNFSLVLRLNFALLMIQRIQSVFLFLVMVAMTLMLFFPLWEKQNPRTTEKVTLSALQLAYQKPAGAAQPQSTVYLAILAGVSIVLAGLSLFSYKNRKTQVVLNLANTLLLAATLMACTYLSFQGEKLLAEPARGQYLLGFFMPAAALVCNALATRFIRRDEQLVRSMDRLR